MTVRDQANDVDSEEERPKLPGVMDARGGAVRVKNATTQEDSPEASLELAKSGDLVAAEGRRASPREQHLHRVQLGDGFYLFAYTDRRVHNRTILRGHGCGDLQKDRL